MIKNTRYKSLHKVKKRMTKNARLRMYKSHVTPVIDYADILYDNANIDILNELQRIQNKCLKTCLDMHIPTVTEKTHAHAEMPMLNVRRKYHAEVYGYKRVQNIKYRTPVRRITRSADAPLLFYSTIKSAAYDGSPQVVCAHAWNTLDSEIRAIDHYSDFKCQAKQRMLSSIPPKALYELYVLFFILKYTNVLRFI